MGYKIGNIIRLFDLSKLKNIDFNNIDMEELKKGIEVEREHSNNLIVRVIIALGHIVEDKQYYTKFLKAGL